MKAAQQLGFGPVIKILLKFSDAFWQKEEALKSAGFIFSNEEIPTWWTQYPQPSGLLVGWCAGPSAKKLQHHTNERLLEKAMVSLTNIFNKTRKELEDKIRTANVFNWATDPFTKGGYTYETVATKEALKVLLQPEKDTVYFAGEALFAGKDVGTVEAALQSGAAAANKMVSTL
jgi:monoamine oxidase